MPERLSEAQLRMAIGEADGHITVYEEALALKTTRNLHSRAILEKAINYQLGKLYALGEVFNGQDPNPLSNWAKEKIDDLDVSDRYDAGKKDLWGRTPKVRVAMREFWTGVVTGIKVSEGIDEKSALVADLK